MNFGIDVSSYQGLIDWKEVKLEGIEFAILKVIRKDLNHDKQFENNWKGCTEAGMHIHGVYNYSYATTVSKAVGDAIKVLEILNGRKVRVYLDVEDQCQKGLGSLLIDIINAYSDVIKSAGLEFGVYTGLSFYNSYIKPFGGLKCPLWIARYGKNDGNLDESYKPDVSGMVGWQFTSKAYVGGINGYVDMNVWYDELEEKEGEVDMAVKIGHASIDERKKIKGGAAGDQTGGEVCIRKWYNKPWEFVLRPKSAKLAEKSAKACESACENKNIGYDQNQRNTLYAKAQKVGFDLSKITETCECDCSSLMHVCALAGGANITYGSNGAATINMKSRFTVEGEYEVLTDKKYLTSDKYLKRGDILVKAGSHTVMVLENGSGVSKMETTNSSEIPNISIQKVSDTKMPTIKKGSTGKAVKVWQAIVETEIDGDFGGKTKAATIAFQQKVFPNDYSEWDGIVGDKTWKAGLESLM